mgnify:CR=1 FL=1
MGRRFYKKGVADGTANKYSSDVIGDKTDAAVQVVGTTKSLMAYLKGLVNFMPVTVVTAAAVMVNGDTIFTVAGGPIEIIHLMSVCVTANDATASTLQYSQTNSELGAATFSGASASLANAAVNSFVTLQKTALATAALLSTEGVTISSTGPSTIIMLPGLIKIVIGVGSTTGTWKHYLTYRPLAVGVTVT